MNPWIFLPTNTSRQSKIELCRAYIKLTAFASTSLTKSARNCTRPVLSKVSDFPIHLSRTAAFAPGASLSEESVASALVRDLRLQVPRSLRDGLHDIEAAEPPRTLIQQREISQHRSIILKLRPYRSTSRDYEEAGAFYA